MQTAVHTAPALPTRAAGVVQPLHAVAPQTPAFELRFESLFHSGRALSFPCDGRGQVELDALSERARRNYFYARTVVGREFATPNVVPAQRN